MQDHALGVELQVLSEQYRNRVLEREKVRRRLPALNDEATRAEREAQLIRQGQQGFDEVTRWRDDAVGRRDDLRDRLEQVEAEMAELMRQQSTLQSKRGPLSAFVEKMIRGLGFATDDFRAELEGRDR
jgi:chromosome segregation ATPase